VALFALGSALSAWAYVVLPLGAAWLVFAIGFPLGFFGSGIFSGLAVYLLRLDLRELDHLRPSLGLLGDELAEFRGRHHQNRAA
jgi:hypothetical protein